MIDRDETTKNSGGACIWNEGLRLMKKRKWFFGSDFIWREDEREERKRRVSVRVFCTYF